jgi:hypothetical protein
VQVVTGVSFACRFRSSLKEVSMNARFTSAIRAVLIATLVCEPSLLFAQSQAWDQKINGSNRFKVLTDFNNEAVLDRETGLVWEQKPEPGAGSWSFVDDECFAHFTGGRLGWRPPTLEEVLSLMDPLQNFTGKLPQRPDLPPISIPLTAAGHFRCRVLNVGDIPLSVQVQLMGKANDVVESNTVVVDPGHTDDAVRDDAGFGSPFHCRFTFLGNRNWVRAGLQLDVEHLEPGDLAHHATVIAEAR